MASQALTDHEQIQRWAEARGAKPACVTHTGLAGWDDGFEKHDEQHLALLVDDEDAKSGTFNKLVRRENAKAQAGDDSDEADLDDDDDDEFEDDDDDEPVDDEDEDEKTSFTRSRV